MKSLLNVLGTLYCVAILLGLSNGSRIAHANDPADSPSLSLRQVQQEEATGRAVNRVTIQQDSDASRWAAGNLKVDNDWQSIRELGPVADNHSAYLEQRTLSNDGEESQLRLARWCKRNGMPNQATAHYYGVLMVNPENLEARKELQHEWRFDRWFTRKEIERAHAQTQQRLKDLNAWLPKLSPIIRKLQSEDATQQLVAIKEIEAITDPAAIPAIELVVMNVEYRIALPWVKQLSQFRSSEACQALLTIAIGQPAEPIAQAVLEQLQRYPEAVAVPQLLNAMSTPIDMTYSIVGLPNGRLTRTTLMSRELKDHRYVQRYESRLRVMSQVASNVSVVKTEDSQAVERNIYLNGAVEDRTSSTVGVRTNTAMSATARYVPEVVFASAHADLQDRAQQLEQTIAAENARISAHNQRVCSVLRALTSEVLDDNPISWWTWWSEHNEKKYEDSKAVQQQKFYDEQQVVVSTERSSTLGDRYYTQRRLADRKELSADELAARERSAYLVRIRTNFGASSCLVAGTRVQTAYGLLPIETIQCGDLVVAKDVETGELALKPVIRTTQGPPRSVVRIETEAGAIVATGGHFWWVSGKGWQRSRALRSGAQLHSATGTVEVVRVLEEEKPQATYNLVVDDFHTYFVGSERVLSYDITPLDGTLHVVPGYSQTAANSKTRVR